MSMITTSISITPYLAEYLRGKYNNGADEPFRIPDNTDLYHVIWTLMSRRHQNQSPIDDGNLTIISRRGVSVRIRKYTTICLHGRPKS